ncbi:hypothetical protein MW887_005145 [Aspergillus wentii]|nr:hypothetical protein MW887_005145 [Aspergillus wentii]
MDPVDADDHELREAIALSLRELYDTGDNPEPVSNGQQQPVVDLTGDSDDDEPVQIYPKSNSVVGSETDQDEDEGDKEADEELRRAIQLSLQSAGEDVNDAAEAPKPSEKTQILDTKPSSEVEPPTKNNKPSQPMGILGLDRRQMEQERLARMGKRKAEDTASIEQPESKLLRTGSVPKDILSTGGAAATTSAGSISSSSGIPAVKQAGNGQVTMPSSTPSVQFPTGVVKKTWAFLQERSGDDIKIEEVFQKSDLELAVLSSFMWDMEWLFSKADTRKTRFLLLMQAKEESTKRQYESETASMKNLRLCFPPMDGQVNCMHSKLMLLFHPEYVRIAVPTANLTSFDWGEQGGLMENSVFIIDLPKKPEQVTSGSSKTAFYEELVYFLKASTLHENIIAKLNSFDFGDSWKRTGYCGLGRAVNSLGLQVSKPINIDYVTSSIGSLTDEFMRSIYLAAQGDDGLTEYTLRTNKSFPARSRTNPTQLIQKATASEWKDDRFRVYFPSERTVSDTKGGPRNAGTICFQSKWYEGAKFPRHVLRDCETRRDRLLMHNKILYVRPDEPIIMQDNSKCRGWAYVGSANLSESAWGRLVQDRTTKEPKLNCRNWECGVLIPVVDKTQNSQAPETKQSTPESPDMLNLFQGTIPIPMQLPGKEFGGNRRPWYYSSTFM